MGENWPRTTHATNSNVFAKENDIKADLSDTDQYLAFFAAALDSSILPHACRPQRADRLGLNTRMVAWRWVTNQIKENAGNSGWMHAGILGAKTDVLARVPP